VHILASSSGDKDVEKVTIAVQGQEIKAESCSSVILFTAPFHLPFFAPHLMFEGHFPGKVFYSPRFTFQTHNFPSLICHVMINFSIARSENVIRVAIFS
jgi:hypothetical protein